jgi:protein TonB
MTVSTETADHLMIDEGYQGASPNARFLAGDVSSGPNANARLGNAMSLSMVSHIGGVLLGLFLVSFADPPAVNGPNPFDLPKDIVWLKQPGPGGGGGGGGNRMPDPPRRAELPGKDKITVPVAKPPKLEAPQPPKEIPKPEAQMNIPAVTTQAGLQEMPGAISALPTTPSQGTGTLGGAGTGAGTGIGSGQGSGLGPGYGGGTGGGAYRLGDAGVVPPRLLKEVKPAYTGDAMRAKIQGVVTVEAIVMPDGRVGQVHVIRSLDRTFGLDEEAIKAVRRWLFAPATRFGQPVPIQIEVELTFTLR